MSLEGDRKKSPKDAIRKGVLVGSLAAATMIYGGVEGKKIGAEEMLDQIDAHWLTPKAVAVLRETTNATDQDVADLEKNLKHLLLNELTRLNRSKS